MSNNNVKPGDVVVVNDRGFVANDYEYDYSLWATTRMRVTLVEGSTAYTEAIDERPDRQWLLSHPNRFRNWDPQQSQMCWPLDVLKLAP